MVEISQRDAYSFNIFRNHQKDLGLVAYLAGAERASSPPTTQAYQSVVFHFPLSALQPLSMSCALI